MNDMTALIIAICVLAIAVAAVIAYKKLGKHAPKDEGAITVNFTPEDGVLDSKGGKISVDVVNTTGRDYTVVRVIGNGSERTIAPVSTDKPDHYEILVGKNTSPKSRLIKITVSAK